MPSAPERLPQFAQLLRQLRRAAGLTQQELAHAARVGVRTLRDLETGRAARPQRSTVELLADALRLDPDARAAFFATARGREGAGWRPGLGPVGPGESGPAGPAAPRGLRPAIDLIGRGATVAALVELLGEATHVTLTGLAGVGKSVLAIAAGHRAMANFAGGVGGVSVTDASDEAEIMVSVLVALGVPRLDDLARLDAGRPCLLIVDGADRNRAPALAAFERLHAIAPGITVLATSRDPLGVRGEHEWPVPPLGLPPASATESEVFEAPAVEFFLDRLRRVRRRPVGLDEAMTLAALVRRLGGVPLALEIAAARGRVLELEEILARCLDTTADADPAGQSLRAAVLGSWELLDPVERVCLSRLSVLRWRWSVPMAEAMLDGVAPGPVDAIALIDRLVALGLVAMRSDGREPRFWVLDPVRDVAIEQADQAGTLHAARDRHGAMIARLAARYLADAWLPDPTAAAAGEQWLEYLAPDIEAALEHARGMERGGDPAVEGIAVDDVHVHGTQFDPGEIVRVAADLARWRARRGVTPAPEPD